MVDPNHPSRIHEEDIDDEEDGRLAMDIAMGFAFAVPIGLAVGMLVLDNIGLGIAFSPVLAVGYGLIRYFMRTGVGDAGM